jgi:hypothetical protein
MYESDILSCGSDVVQCGDSWSAECSDWHNAVQYSTVQCSTVQYPVQNQYLSLHGRLSAGRYFVSVSFVTSLQSNLSTTLTTWNSVVITRTQHD